MASPEQNGPPRPPFISSQRLWRLVCPPRHQRACLRPEHLWALPRSDKDSDNIRPIEVHGVPRGQCQWERVEDRPAFLKDMSRKRLCLTVDAGVGKTTALKQAQYLRQTGDNEACVAMRIEFAELPSLVDWFLDYGNPDPMLVECFKTSIQRPRLHKDVVQTLLARRIRQGGFTLLVDALDQSRAMDRPEKSCIALREFLDRYPEVRCVVTGRPFSIRRYWHDLFDPERFGERAAWDFAMVDVFTGEEARAYVGPQKQELLNQLGADVIAIPRSLEMIRQVSADGLGTLRTKSDVYWAALDGMLRKALEGMPSGIGLGEEQARRLFSLVACEMSRRGFRGGTAGVSRQDYDEFLAHLWSHRFEKVESDQDAERSTLRVALDIGSPGQLHERVGRLCAVNEHLTDPALEGRDHPDVVHLYWRNQTLQDMFTAVWMAFYAGAGDGDWLYERRGEEAWKELWQLTAEMGKAGRHRYVFPGVVGTVYPRVPVSENSDAPNDAVVPGTTRESPQQRSTSSWWRWLFPSPVLKPIPQRAVPLEERASEAPAAPSSEWIYRSLRGMLECASPGCDVSTDEKLREATTKWQREARAIVDEASSVEAARHALRDGENPAREVLLQFLGEYPLILKGARGREAQGVAEEFESSFRWVPEKETDSLEFWMGEKDSPTRTPIPARFRLSRYPVTNELMGLWDPGHMGRESGYHKYSPDPRCPAIEVDWYTAWCVSVWLGGYLPTEEESEYACRAQPLSGEATLESHPPTDYCFGNREEELEDYAWYQGNAEGRTHPVGQKYANSFDLCDMHGNVDEWCDSWLNVGVGRVYRGGSWSHEAGYCRSADRSRIEPSNRCHFLGFRVAQVPSSGERSKRKGSGVSR